MLKPQYTTILLEGSKVHVRYYLTQNGISLDALRYSAPLTPETVDLEEVSHLVACRRVQMQKEIGLLA